MQQNWAKSASIIVEGVSQDILAIKFFSLNRIHSSIKKGEVLQEIYNDKTLFYNQALQHSVVSNKEIM